MQKGYIKQTTDVKKIQASINALNEAGIASGDIIIAEDFVAVLDGLNKGDTLFIYRFADICNSLPAVFQMIEQFCTKGVDIYSIEDWWITERTAENFLPISQALNALNREIVSQRTKQGLQQRVSDGGRLGREPGVKNKPKVKTMIIKKSTK